MSGPFYMAAGIGSGKVLTESVGLSTSEPWYSPIRAIHDEHFYDPWEERLAQINARYGLQGDHALLTHGPGLPPPWFNGDIEAVEPGKWVLVISLNPRIDHRKQDALKLVPRPEVHARNLLGPLATLQHQPLVSRLLRPACQPCRRCARSGAGA